MDEKKTAQVNTIAILTSGGDAPGMNAAIRAVVRAGIGRGLKVLGVKKGYNGLIDGDLFKMNLRSVRNIIHRGGTFLYTARSARFMKMDGIKKAKETCLKNKVDAVIIIGGDGSFKGASELAKLSVPCIGIPATIDNDIGSTEYTIGFDTAMNTAMEMVDRLRDTAQSHSRCSVVEVMGRRSGEIALKTGIAVGATAILVPEIPLNFDRDILDRIKKTQKTGKEHFIVVVSEGVNNIGEISR
ncbi:MAG: ATP-dependent 6-phosphofructokinase, partial [Clostridia bacterium]|nr:ATP-dependent 6-phosphofructokinase [Clostridia bacterium]